MPKVKRPQIAGPAYHDDERDAPPPRASSRPSRRPRDIPYSVAWFRDRFATYALGTIICGAVMLTVAAWMGGTLGMFGQRMNNGFNVIAGWAGISVKDVKVCAHSEADENSRTCHSPDPAVTAKVLAAVEVQNGASILSADPYAIRDRVEKLDIGDVSVQRLWPDRVRIDVEQRKPIALSQEDGEGGAWRVVDQSGRAFAQADLAKYGSLPRVVGKDASKAAGALVAAMEPYPNLSERMEVAYRISGRRWDVKFKGRTDVVSFPVDARLSEQLEALNLMQAQNRVLDLPATHIDARHPKYIALRPLPGATPTPGAT
ncbi:MAG: FtsQ-type POTRA domain-containing protein [Hyphomonadaceae bacterium]